jgi:hypothetical protein
MHTGSEWPVFHELLSMSNSSIPATQVDVPVECWRSHDHAFGAGQLKGLRVACGQVLIELHPLRLEMYPALYPGSVVQSVASFFEGMRYIPV